MLIEFHNKLAIPKVETNDITWIYFSLTSKQEKMFASKRGLKKSTGTCRL